MNIKRAHGMTDSVENRIRLKAKKILDEMPEKDALAYINGTPNTQERIIQQYLLKPLQNDILPLLSDKDRQTILKGTDSERARVLTWHLGTIFKLARTPNRLFIWYVKFAPNELESAFQNETDRTKLLDEIDRINAYEIDRLASIPPAPENKANIIKSYANQPKTIKISPTIRPLPDLSRVVVLGDVDFNNCKLPKTENGIYDILKLMPLAVFGKIDCTNWNRELFSRITKLPMADIIDCSHSISKLDDLTGKLPIGLKKLVVQSTLLKGEKREATQQFLESIKDSYPELEITDKDNKNTISLAIIAANKISKDAADSILQQNAQQAKPLEHTDLQKSAKNGKTPEPEIPAKESSDVDQRDARRALQDDDDIVKPIKEKLPQLLQLVDFKKCQNASDILKILVDKAFRNMSDKIVKKVRPDGDRPIVNCLEQTDLPTIAEMVKRYTMEFIAQTKEKPNDNETISESPKALEKNTTITPMHTTHDNSGATKRTIWITKNVLNYLKKIKNKTHFDYIKWIQDLTNLDTAIETQKVQGTKPRATALEIKTIANSGPRIYAAPFNATHMLIFAVGDKDSQKQRDIDNIKKNAKLYEEINKSLKDVSADTTKTTRIIEINKKKHSETLYNFDTDATRKLLGLPLEPKQQELTAIILPDKETIDSIDSNPTNDKFIVPAYNHQYLTPRENYEHLTPDEAAEKYCVKHNRIAHKDELAKAIYNTCEILFDNDQSMYDTFKKLKNTYYIRSDKLDYFIEQITGWSFDKPVETCDIIQIDTPEQISTQKKRGRKPKRIEQPTDDNQIGSSEVAKENVQKKTMLDVKAAETFSDAWLQQLNEQFNTSQERVTTAEKKVNDSQKIVKTTKQKLQQSIENVEKITNQIQQRLTQGRFDFEDLRVQGAIEKQNQEQVEQKLADAENELKQNQQELDLATKERDSRKTQLDKGKKLIQQRILAEQALKDANDALAQFLKDETDSDRK